MGGKAMLSGKARYAAPGEPSLFRRIAIPAELLTDGEHDGRALRYGGDIRVGDLTGDGRPDLLVYRSADSGVKPCFMGAFDMDGRILWQVGEGGEQPLRPGAVAIHDIDGDGAAEAVCLFLDPAVSCDANSMANTLIQVREGSTGEIKLQRPAPPELARLSGSGANWFHQRILIANFTGRPTPCDFVIKVGDTILAFDQRLEPLWTYRIRWNEYGDCSAYTPAVGDIDGDGMDEVNGGYFLLDHDGRPLWEKKLARNMDSVAITEWDNGRTRAICSGGGRVLDERGNVIVSLGEDEVPHGQEVRCGRFLADSPGPDMIIRRNGHNTDAVVVNNGGEVVRRFNLNESPNNTGMEAVYWNGADAPALLCNGGVLWRGDGELFRELPGLPRPKGPPRMGWYHCIAGDFCGDEREEVLIYNPWADEVFIYTPAPLAEDAYTGYCPGPRQYNARLMD